jgi:hypothetical protein
MTQLKIYSGIFLILGLGALGLFGFCMDSGSFRIQYLLLGCVFLFLSMILSPKPKRRP